MIYKHKLAQIKRYSQTLRDNGFFSIFISQVINKILLFSTSVIVVRLISKSDYGLYSYAYNIVSMFLLINGLGVLSGFLQFGSEFSDNPSKSKAFEKYTMKIGFIASVFLSFCILFFTYSSISSIENSKNLLLSLSLIPIFNFINSFYETKLRVFQQNKQYSLFLNINSTIYFIGIIIGSIQFGVFGIVLAKYISYIFSILYGITVTKKSNTASKNIRVTNLNSKEKKDFMNLSLVSIINNAISQMLYLLDVFIIGLVLVDTSIIASYKTATIIPFALTFIPLSVVIFAYPYYAKNHTNIQLIKLYTKYMITGLICFNGVITIFLICFAKNIIYMLFGVEYFDSITPFIILSIGFFISGSFRIPLGNILFSLKKIKFNLLVSILTGLTNIILNYILIVRFGSIGAAFATLSVYTLSSILSTWYFIYLINRGGLHLESTI